MSDRDDQDEEMVALSSIYDNDVFTASQDGGQLGGQFQASLPLPQPFTIILKAASKPGKGSVTLQGEHKVHYLPSVILNFQLPPEYPSGRPPQFTLSCKWLSKQQLTDLCQRLDNIWKDNKGSVILFMWISFLQDEAFEFLSILSPLDLSHVLSHRHERRTRKNDGGRKSKHKPVKYDMRGIQDIASQHLLLPALLEYDKQERQRQFDKTVFACKVCFQDKLGALCTFFFGCDHVYCKECMAEYFVVQIEDGNVKGLYCPEDKCDSQAHPSQVKALVSAKTFSRYDDMLLQAGLQTMQDIVYCPRPSCQCPVLLENSSTMGSCAACNFVFCSLCKLAYHGISPCRIKTEELKKLRKEWMKADETTREQLERRYGKQMIRQAIEETISVEWLELYAKKCPHCSTQIQKIDGCNKMTCSKCRTYFCWLCNEMLSRNNPYGHFNDPNANCFNRLFVGVNHMEAEDMVDEEDEDDDYQMDDDDDFIVFL